MLTRNTLAAAPALLLILSAPLFSDDGLPAADDVIARYIEAVGGEEKLRSIESMRTKGTMQMPAMGMEGQLDMIMAAPNRMLMKIELPGMGEVNVGYDGEVAWQENPMTGPALIQGEQLDDVLKQADFYSDLNYETLYPTRETVEKVEFAGEPCYKLKLLEDDGTETLQYFSVESGLLVGFEGEQTSEMGTVHAVSEIYDYQDFDGRKVPMRVVQKMMGMETMMVMTEVSFDDVDDSVFALPDAIKTLVGDE